MIFGESIEKYAYHTLQLLLKYKILNLEEIKHFEEKIKISYTLACDETHGSFQYRQKGDGTRVPEGIEILISLCKPLAEETTLQEHMFWHMNLGIISIFLETRITKNLILFAGTSNKNSVKKATFIANTQRKIRKKTMLRALPFGLHNSMGLQKRLSKNIDLL